MTELGTEGGTARSSSRRRRKRGISARFRFARHLPAISDRMLNLAVGAATIVTLLAGWHEFRQGETVYPEIWLGASRSEVEYGFGNPERRIADGVAETWTYDARGTIQDVSFRNDRAVQVGCTANGADCAPLMGLDTTAYEDWVWTRLGMPTHQHIDRGRKILDYDELGISYELQRFKVVRASLRETDGFSFGALGRFLLLMLP